MEEILVIDSFIDRKDYHQIVTLEELHTRLDKLDFDGIRLIDGEIVRVEGKCIKVLSNNMDHPFVIDKITNTLTINPTWYLNNQEQADELINYICKNKNKKEFTIHSKALITDELIKSICQNKTIEKITLAKYSENTYKLSNKHYQLFKQSTIKKVNTDGVEKELEENFDSIISYNADRMLITYYLYEDLASNQEETINIKYKKEEELDSLKYLNPIKRLRIDSNDLTKIEKVINRLNDLNFTNDLIIEVTDKNIFNDYIFNNKLNYPNIYINSNNMELSLKDYLKFEKQLYELIEPAKDLSPFEKYIYAYNTAKQFKQYKENEEDKHAARDLYRILENEFIVCVGFSELFGDLLSKLGIQSTKLSVDVDTSYDKISEDQNEERGKPIEQAGHARRYIYIKDEKYGIDGFYISDPTWDNNLEKDYYNHLALTDEEITTTRRYNWININSADELLNITTIEEFYQKIKFITTRQKSFLYGKEESLIRNLLNSIITKLDQKFYKELLVKYPFIEDFVWPENINDLIYDLGEYIVKHTNKEISGTTIIEAVKNVYKYGYNYTDEKVEELIPIVIEDNKKRQDTTFPKRYKEDESGNKEVVMNKHNKFEIDSENQKKY